MTNEHDGANIPLTAIHIDLQERLISFQAEDQTLARLHFGGEAVLFEGPPRVPSELPAPASSSEPAPAALPTTPTEHEGPVTLVAKLVTRPKFARGERDGVPTATATVAVQEEGRADPHLYRATFPPHTDRIVRRLRPESHLILEGYPSASTNPRQPLESFAVTTIVAHPGKPARPGRREKV
jgi:hypothetical protein